MQSSGPELKGTEFSEGLCVSFVLGTGTGKGGGRQFIIIVHCVFKHRLVPWLILMDFSRIIGNYFYYMYKSSINQNSKHIHCAIRVVFIVVLM